MHGLMTVTVIYALVGAVAGVLIPVMIPSLFKKASTEVLEDISEVSKVAHEVTDKDTK
jgi:hypothetical protein